MGVIIGMTEERQVEDRVQRLNLILRTIRNVDQVILKEKDRDRLTKGICKSLVGTRGYYNAWIALLDESGKFTTFAEAGLGKRFLQLARQLEHSGATSCGRKALAKRRAVVISDPALSCIDCPLAREYSGRGGIAARLHYRGKLYGLLCASIPSSLVAEEEERSLFEEVAGDIAFTLHKIELEEEGERAEEALRRSENRYRALFDSANDGMLVRDLDGNIIMTNSAMAELTGYTIDELSKMNISQLLSAASFRTKAEGQITQLEDESGAVPQRYELQMIRKDGIERTIEVVTSLLDEEQPPIVQEIARDITEQKRARENLRAYTGRALFAQEEERQRIARELHDETAQALASLGMDIGTLAKNKGWSFKEVSKNLEELRCRTEEILRGVRSLSQALRPPMLEEFGLMAALQGLTSDLTSQHGIDATSDIQGTPRRLSSDTELAIFRIAQEALNNIWKHAQATQCSLEVKFSPKKVSLKISDNGQGFDLPTVTEGLAYSGKLGMTGMQERARSIASKLTISSKPGQGTTVVLEVPQ